MDHTLNLTITLNKSEPGSNGYDWFPDTNSLISYAKKQLMLRWEKY